MAANKTSAIADQEPVDILFALQPGFDILDFAGPLAAFHKAQHDPADSCMYLFCMKLGLPAHVVPYPMLTRFPAITNSHQSI